MRCESHSRVPHTPASEEARAGNGRGRGRVLPCSSLSTQVLHRRRPGRTERAQAVAAFKYWQGDPSVPTVSLVAQDDSQLGWT